MEFWIRDHLDDLRFHWGEVYEFGYNESRQTWSARFTGTHEEITGRTADELRQLVRADYQRRQAAGQARRDHPQARFSA